MLAISRSGRGLQWARPSAALLGSFPGVPLTAHRLIVAQHCGRRGRGWFARSQANCTRATISSGFCLGSPQSKRKEIRYENASNRGADCSLSDGGHSAGAKPFDAAFALGASGMASSTGASPARRNATREGGSSEVLCVARWQQASLDHGCNLRSTDIPMRGSLRPDACGARSSG
jgi:hypothetical protein